MEDGADVSRRQVLIGGGLAASAPLLAGAARPAPAAASLVRRPGTAGAPAPEQVHVQYGADAASQAAVSWAAAAPVSRPRLRLRPARPRVRHRDPGAREDLHRGADRGDGPHLPRPARPAARGHRVRVRGAARRRAAGDRRLPHRAARPVPRLPLHQLRRPVGPRPGRLRARPEHAERGLHRGRGRRPRPAVPPGQRGPVLRQHQRRPGRDLDLVLHQQHALGPVPAVDAVRRQPRERGRQRPAGLPGLPDPVRAAGQRLAPSSAATGTRSRSGRSG